jgi:hypothetical protein
MDIESFSEWQVSPLITVPTTVNHFGIRELQARTHSGGEWPADAISAEIVLVDVLRFHFVPS